MDKLKAIKDWVMALDKKKKTSSELISMRYVYIEGD